MTVTARTSAPLKAREDGGHRLPRREHGCAIRFRCNSGRPSSARGTLQAHMPFHYVVLKFLRLITPTALVRLGVRASRSAGVPRRC